MPGHGRRASIHIKRAAAADLHRVASPTAAGFFKPGLKVCGARKRRRRITPEIEELEFRQAVKGVRGDGREQVVAQVEGLESLEVPENGFRNRGQAVAGKIQDLEGTS